MLSGSFIAKHFPQVRAFAESAYDTMMKAGASKSGPPPSTRNLDEEINYAKDTLISLLPTELQRAMTQYPSTFGVSLEHQSALVADLVYSRRFSEKEARSF